MLKAIVGRIPGAERLARLFVDQRYRLARRHLHGIGVEIGALDRPLMLPFSARAFYLDRLLPRDLRLHYPELNGRKLYVSFVADGENMDCVREESLDFVIANHVIEHCEDPIATLLTFSRKLKPGGIVFMAVPDMRLTFDAERDETPFQHLIEDHQSGVAQSRAGHYQEWAEKVEHRQDDDARRRAAELLAQRYSIHYHCWTRDSFENFLHEVATMVPLAITDVKSWRNENVFIVRKT